MDNKLPEGWICSTISSIANVKGGKRLPKGKSFSNSSTNHPYLRVTDFQDGNIITLGLKYIDEDTFNDISTYTINKGDLYISIAGTIGLVGSIPDYLDGANLTENAAKICDIEINKNYLKFFLNSNYAKNQFIEKTVSSGQPKLALFRIRDCELFVAPLPEQKVIAEKLDSLLAQVDSTKARLESIPGILKQFRQSVLAAAVSGEIIPRKSEYKLVDLDSLCASGATITYGVIKLGEDIKDGVPCLRTSNVRWLNIELDDVKKIDRKLSDSYSRTILNGGEVLVNVRGTLGGVAPVPLTMKGWNVSREVAVIPLDEVRANSEFVALWIASTKSQQWLADVSKGVAYVGINLVDLRALPIELPATLEEQEEIVDQVRAFFGFADKVAAQVKTAMESVNHLTQSILAQAFSGELTKDWREQNPDLISGENSAAALLERIKAERAKLKPAPQPRELTKKATKS